MLIFFTEVIFDVAFEFLRVLTQMCQAPVYARFMFYILRYQSLFENESCKMIVFIQVAYSLDDVSESHEVKTVEMKLFECVFSLLLLSGIALFSLITAQNVPNAAETKINLQRGALCQASDPQQNKNLTINPNSAKVPDGGLKVKVQKFYPERQSVIIHQTSCKKERKDGVP
uniref:Uncharacterized protein n=1 Tax=Tetranychus urticae TaxID=32264 RepID=T1KG48_TETUR